jgi:hypothetical protein
MLNTQSLHALEKYRKTFRQMDSETHTGELDADVRRQHETHERDCTAREIVRKIFQWSIPKAASGCIRGCEIFGASGASL